MEDVQFQKANQAIQKTLNGEKIHKIKFLPSYTEIKLGGDLGLKLVKPTIQAGILGSNENVAHDHVTLTNWLCDNISAPSVHEQHKKFIRDGSWFVNQPEKLYCDRVTIKSCDADTNEYHKSRDREKKDEMHYSGSCAIKLHWPITYEDKGTVCITISAKYTKFMWDI